MRLRLTIVRLSLVMLSAAVVSGCGGGDDSAGNSRSTGGGSSSGGNATGGSATGGNATGGNATGGNATGGNATGGNATGGSAGSGAGGSSSGMCGLFEEGETTGDVTQYCGSHCSPGQYDAYGSSLANCFGYELVDGVGIQNDMPDYSFSIRDIELPEPMVPGQPYAFSSENQHFIHQTEFWGANEECGVGLELLWSGPQSKETIACFEFLPSAAYTHLLMVWKGGGQFYGTTFCPQGSCG